MTTRRRAFDERAFIDAVRRGRVVVSSGPFVRLGAGGADVGDEIAPGDDVAVHVHVEAPPWVDVSTVRARAPRRGRRDLAPARRGVGRAPRRNSPPPAPLGRLDHRRRPGRQAHDLSAPSRSPAVRLHEPDPGSLSGKLAGLSARFRVKARDLAGNNPALRTKRARPHSSAPESRLLGRTKGSPGTP